MSRTLTIDAHNHLGARHGAEQSGDELVIKLDDAGVDRAVVFPFVEGQFSNDVITDAVTAHPERLLPFCAVNPWHGDAAVEEVRIRAEAGFLGVKMHPTLHGYHLSDHDLVDPVFNMIREAGLVVICHGASDIFNAPPELAAMARSYPEVPILMAHSGIFWSHEQAVDLAREIPNLYLETARVPIFEVAYSIRVAGPEKVIWGTDSPFVDYRAEFDKMANASDSAEARELVLGGNLSRLLDLE